MSCVPGISRGGAAIAACRHAKPSRGSKRPRRQSRGASSSVPPVPLSQRRRSGRPARAAGGRAAHRDRRRRPGRPGVRRSAAGEGHSAVVYEAGSRLGGRCFSNRTLVPGMACENGGELIDTGHKTMLRYANEFGLRARVVHEEARRRTLLVLGRPWSDEDVVDNSARSVADMQDDLHAISGSATVCAPQRRRRGARQHRSRHLLRHSHERPCRSSRPCSTRPTWPSTASRPGSRARSTSSASCGSTSSRSSSRSA